MKKTVQTNYVKYGELRQIKGVTTIIRADIAGKQDKLTTAQMAAVDSGITAAKVLFYDNAASLAHSHANKTSVLDKLRWDAQNNAIYIGDAEHPINFYAFGAITAGGVGSGGIGGQGGISTIYLGSSRYDAAEGSTAIYLPAYPTQVTWANISGKPSWIGSSKPSYAFSEITGTAAAAQIPSLDASKITSGTFDAARIPNLSWNKISSDKPTTIAGYGITDGVTTAALAAWAGSVNITKVGTIATGVWHGTAIGDTYIASATNWNDAYDKRHTHSNKTVLDSITAQDLTDLRNLASWLGFDSTNNAVYVKKSATNVARNFYVFGAITAGGVGSGGGGSTGALYTCVDVTAYNDSKVGRDSTHPAQSGDLLAYDGNKWHAVVAPATGVTTFNNRTGAVTLSSTDVTTALGYTPYNASNPSGYISEADHIACRDTRSANPLPYSTDFKLGVEYALKNNSADGLSQGGTYHGVLTLHQWRVETTGDAWQLGFTHNGRIFSRYGTSDWSAWNGLAYISDIPTSLSSLSADATHRLVTDTQIGNWNTAYGWGNHASAGYAAASTLSAHTSNTSNPHSVTKAQVGLGNVDNTADADKSVARAHGLTSVRITTSFDLNTALSGGGVVGNLNSVSYWVNGPSGMSYGSVAQIQASADRGDQLALQLAWDINHNTTTPTRRLWFRASNNLGWQNDWMQIYHSGNLTAATLGAETTTHAAATYLPLTGGKINGNLQIGLDDNTAYKYLRVVRGGYYAELSVTNRLSLFLSDGTTLHGLYILSDGRLTYDLTQDIYHSGNSNKSDVAWTCSTLTASGNITGSLLKSTNNGNTVTIGSQDSGFCHIYNSADIPFIFNKEIQTYGGLIPYGNGSHPLGNSTHVWGDAYLTKLYASGNITTTGRLGVGVATPSYSLDVLQSATTAWAAHFSTPNSAVFLAYGAGNGIFVGKKGADNYLVNMRYNETSLGSGGDMAFYISGSGSVGIGTETPSQKLHVVGNIVATGAITAGAASDARLKDNIRNITNAVAVLKSLRPVSFDWNATATSNFSALKGHDVGLVAQEVEPYIPSAIGAIFGDYKRLDYTKVTPYLIAGWQDHESRIAALERENAELKRRLNIN